MLYIHDWRYQVALGMYTTAQDQGKAEPASRGDARVKQGLNTMKRSEFSNRFICLANQWRTTEYPTGAIPSPNAADCMGFNAL